MSDTSTTTEAEKTNALLTQPVFVRYKPGAGVGSYSHGNKACHNFAFGPGDKVMEVPLGISLLMGRSMCGFCLVPHVEPIAKAVVQAAKDAAQDPDPEAGKVAAVTVNAMAADAAAEEAVKLDDDEDESKGEDDESE